MANCYSKKCFDFLDVPAWNPHTVGALYVHVPLCKAKCRYCDFYSQAAQPGLAELIVKTLTAELAQRRNLITKPLKTIFLGGGTPTALPAKLLGQLLEHISPLADEDTEFTIEANPGTVDSAVGDILAQAGVNRVSLGGQSFDACELEMLGRIHKPDQIGQAVEFLENAWVRNISLDLMYALPGQTVATWLRNLQAATQLNVQHISCYALSFEPGTALFEDLSAGRVKEVDDETQREMYYETINFLTANGFEHYEISNFAKPGQSCKHNLTYWQNEEYLGIGPAACSYIQGERRTNTPDLTSYAKNIEQGLEAPFEAERITGQAHMAETLMLGFRLIEGVDIKKFIKKFDHTPAQAFPESFGKYTSLGAIQQTETHVHLSQDALFTADSILADIVAEASSQRHL